MIKFFIRLSILLIAIIVTVGFTAGLNISAFFAACIFVSAWVMVVSFRDIVWWIFTFAIIFSVLHYDVFALYVIGIMSVAFVFDFLCAYAVRTANNNFFILSGTVFILSLIAMSIVEMVQYHHVFISGQSIAGGFIMTLFFFFLFHFIIKQSEKFINLYTYGTDMRSHT